MPTLRAIRCVLTSTAVAGMLLPLPFVQGAQPASQTEMGSAIVVDVALGTGGELFGQVVDADGRPVAGTQVAILNQTKNQVTRWPTDRAGRFVARNMSGGLHQLQTPNGLLVCRCWVVRTAPPASTNQLLIIDDARIARGQRPIGELLTPIVIGLLIATAIAVPIAVHNSQDAS